MVPKDKMGNYRKIEEHHRLVPHGFAVFTVDHRGSPGHGEFFSSQQDLGGADLDDVIAGTRHLMAQKEIDVKRVAILGGSRGAYLAALAIERASFYRAAVLMMGFYDLERFMRYEQRRRREDSHFVKYLQMSWEEMWKLFPIEERSPIRFVEQVSCPVLLIHGERDDSVPPEQSCLMHERLLAACKESKLLLFPDLEHEYSRDTPQWREIWRVTAKYLHKMLQR